MKVIFNTYQLITGIQVLKISETGGKKHSYNLVCQKRVSALEYSACIANGTLDRMISHFDNKEDTAEGHITALNSFMPI